MKDRLTLDTDALHRTGTNLRRIAQEFDTATARSTRASHLVGHSELADCVMRFADGWDGKRAKIVERIADLAQACEAVATEFDGLDTTLGAAVRGDTP